MKARNLVLCKESGQRRFSARGASGQRQSLLCRKLLSFMLVLVFGVCGLSVAAAQQLGTSETGGDTMMLTGDWSGSLKLGATSLRIVFHVTASNGLYSATMDSPDQGAKGIPVSEIRAEDTQVRLEVAAVGGTYLGALDENGNLKGSWKQSGLSFPLNLTRQKGQTLPTSATEKPKTDWEPAPPFPYIVRDVDFINEKAGIHLAGTLTLPQGRGPFPAVVLVTGSGPQNRDEEILGHRPFLVIADYLTRRGIAVLRYDDRGIGGSKGDFQTATTFDFAGDAHAALDFLAGQPEIDGHHLGVIGHSEGAIVASILAARGSEATEEAAPSFIVLLGGPGVRGDELLLMQNAALGRASGLDERQISEANNINRKLYAIAMSDEDIPTLREKMIDTLNTMIDSTQGLTKEQRDAQKARVPAQAEQLLSPWMRTFLSIDPSMYLKKVKVPVLALDGSKDLQVPAEQNLAAIAAALKSAGTQSGEMVELDGLNHLFQHAKTGLPSEYAEIEETFAPEALKRIGDWVLSVVSR